MSRSPAQTPTADSPGSTEPRRRRPLHTKILIGLLLGAVLGIASHWVAARPRGAGGGEQPAATDPQATDPQDTDANGLDDRLDWLALDLADPLGRIFLRLVLMVVLPLVFSALALAVVELGDLRHLGSIGLRTLLLTLLLSSIAVMIGVCLVNAVRRASG